MILYVLVAHNVAISRLRKIKEFRQREHETTLTTKDDDKRLYVSFLCNDAALNNTRDTLHNATLATINTMCQNEAKKN